MGLRNLILHYMLQFLKERLQRGGTDLVAKFVTEFVCDSGGGLGNSGCPVGLLLL